MLEETGLTAAEEAVYRALVAVPSASDTELAETLGRGRYEVTRALDRLETLGLVSRTAGRDSRYLAAPPELAVEPLILAQQLRLEQARAAAAGLMDIYRSARKERGAAELVEVVSGPEAVEQRMEQIHRGARTQVRALIAPPLVIDGTDNRYRRLELEQLARGIQYQMVYDQDGFAAQGGLEAMLADSRAGEEARVIENVPIKLFLVDRQVAFVPMAVDDAATDAVIVHCGGLLSALNALFDQVWERAVPFALAAGGAGREQGRLDPESRRLLTMLRAGFTDETMARHLGTSTRTVQRRIRQLMNVAGVATRFQLGWRAGDLGWLDECEREERGGPVLVGAGRVNGSVRAGEAPNRIGPDRPVRGAHPAWTHGRKVSGRVR